MPFGDIIGHEKPKSWMRAALRRGHLPHASLFGGEDSIGKRLFAIHLTQTIMCEAPPGTTMPDSCGHCRSCLQVACQTHPDFLVIAPEQDKAHPQISIDQVRSVEHHMIYRPLWSPYKICLIDDADRLTLSAANALLKTLEEPPDHSLFFLITSQPATLLATIRSRCLFVPFTPPSQSAVEGALMLKKAFSPEDARFLALVTQCRLGQALTMDVNQARTRQEHILSIVAGTSTRSLIEIFDTAESLAKDGFFHDSLFWLSSSLRDILLTRIGVEPTQLFNPEQSSLFRQLTSTTQISSLLELIEEFQSLEKAPTRNLNLQLNLESFLLKLQQTFLPQPL